MHELYRPILSYVLKDKHKVLFHVFDMVLRPSTGIDREIWTTLDSNEKLLCDKKIQFNFPNNKAESFF